MTAPRKTTKYKILKNYTGDLKGGTEARLYDDGSTRNESGLLLVKPSYGHTISSSEEGRALHKHRFDLARHKAAEGMIEAAIEAGGLDPSKATASEAWRLVVKHFVTVFLKSTSVRGLGEAFTKIGIATGFLGNDQEQKGTTQNVYMSLELRELLTTLADAARETIDGKTID